jgi:polyisoprenoid-binding protein YceI/cytochrome b561
VMIVLQYVLAKTADGLPLGRQKLEVLNFHKSMGLTILALAALRLTWRLFNRAPLLPPTLKPYERVLANVTHAALYAFLFAMPITGWMLSSAANFPVNWFDVLRLPHLLDRDRELARSLEFVHETLFKGLVLVAVLHIAGALKHHFWYKDDVLKRMLPFTSIAALSLLGLLAATTAGAARPYTVDPADSKLGFVVTQSEGDVEGEFARFRATIVFAPEDLAASRFDVLVETGSVDTGDDDRDTAIRDADLLDVAKFPTARFTSSAFTHRSGDQYEGVGKLTLRGVTRDVRLPFTWKVNQENGRSVARLEGETTVNRLDFGVGQGDWKDTELVGNAVRITYSLELRAAD